MLDNQLCPKELCKAEMQILVEDILKVEREQNKKDFARKLVETLVFGFTGVVLMGFATGIVGFIWSFVTK